MQEEFFDALRHIFILLWIGSFFPCILVHASNIVPDKSNEIEIRAFRLQQYEFAGKPYGSKSWKVLYEAVSLNGSTLRKCVLVSWRDLVNKELESTIGAAVGAVVVAIPEDLNALTENEKQAFQSLEQKFYNFRTEQGRILRSKHTYVQHLYNSVAANNFQISSSNSATSNLVTLKNYNVLGHLNAGERGKPYIFVVAYYDTHSMAPVRFNSGVDSNGSGVATLLEILAILSRFYSDAGNRAKYNIVFVLSTAGKFNYQGSRQWIEDFQEKHSDENVVFSLCLDASRCGVQENQLVCRSVGLEHEVYNIRRIHALTISHFDNHLNPMRNSMLDTRESVDVDALEKNVKTIANALVSFVYELDPSLCSTNQSKNGCSLLTGSSGVNRQRLVGWLDTFGSSPRSIASAHTSKVVVADLKDIVGRYADKAVLAEVNVADYVLYDVFEDNLSADIVKPAIFELFLAVLICAYLFVIYQFSLHAQSILETSIVRLKKLT
uniref:BOS complex subunit NCLN n=1 Tax=Ditylenchus dipsaci TaxID=166011 RepID=A0A915D332_9BILA